MPIYENVLKEKGWNANRPSINEHFKHLRTMFPSMFEGRAFNTYMQTAIKAAEKVLKDNSIPESQHDNGWTSIPGGRGSKARREFIAAIERVLQDAVSGIYPLPPRTSGVSSTYKDVVAAGSVVFANTGLKAKIPRDAEIKIASIYDCGDTYGGHGPTRSLGAGVLHAHVGGGDGLGFSWHNKVLTIHAYGVKSDSAGNGTSGYKWTTR